MKPRLKRKLRAVVIALLAVPCLILVWGVAIGYRVDLIPECDALTQTRILARRPSLHEMVIVDRAFLSELEAELRNHRDTWRSNLDARYYLLEVVDANGVRRQFDFSSIDFAHFGRTPQILADLIWEAERSGYSGWTALPEA